MVTGTLKPPGSPLLRPFYPGFDGLRAIAFLMVFAYHYGVKGWDIALFRWGWIGVDLFFALSGFLITGILWDSLSDRNYFRNFYIRRALRIFPLFYGFWIVLLIAAPFVHIAWTWPNLTLATYIGNWFIAGADLGAHANPALISFFTARHPGQVRFLSLGHLWSLCVEEQFYVFWPAVVFFVRSRRALLGLCLTLLALLPIARVLYSTEWPQMVTAGALYHDTWSHCDGLLAGAALAVFLRVRTPSPACLQRISAFVVILCFALAAVTLRLGSSPVGNRGICTIGFTLIALGSTAVLLLVLTSGRLARALDWAPLRSLGRISYGLYFFHAIPIEYVSAKIADARSPVRAWLVIALTFLLTLLAALLSYRFYEAQFLRLKSVFAPTRGRIADPPANPAQLSARIPAGREAPSEPI